MIAKLKSQVSAIDCGMHRIASGLRPAALDDLGLVAALSVHVEEWARHTGIAVDFCSSNVERRLSSAIETTVYRIVQEALTNVMRHSGAKNASVVVECRGDRVVAVVEDDGCGVAGAGGVTGGAGQHLGLIGIRERAGLLGGDVQIESGPHGMSVFVSLPLAFQRDSRGQ